ncbi:MAG: Unknown protein [uncultured Sulfurovum sp.]|uniref:N-acetyltransferase domain-containing protein n=1 Tax=uncultured Sulfurovum sp. TaxID=269237 RepID=A0A6S6U2Y7_9BACT|nr:MAG: Unknown protein [uncultured Sulfurovum sp.]
MMSTDINTIKQNSFKIVEENKNLKNITTVYNHATSYKLDLYIDAEIIGFIDYKIKDEVLKKIYISQISIDAYYQRNGLGTYLINCLKKEFNTIGLLSIGKSLNIFYEKNHFEEDLSKKKQRNNRNYVWTKQS